MCSMYVCTFAFVCALCTCVCVDTSKLYIWCTRPSAFLRPHVGAVIGFCSTSPVRLLLRRALVPG